ncbi:hypothetical protein Dform_00992 [Dehalogenimonas formicexedens]|uniref:DUF1648 domain-containing protein n=1 Tax=Dehalogenimonas formicexedens TaxID=1839801 RepID=A0A1P8F7C4_9CHLR|nr:DUF1648 domain-containing protein [Dehalogenimonas formicexedens]APV44333.1 hypothetical protein Dform_00992 [Dehalogenimonas formicexedens]
MNQPSQNPPTPSPLKFRASFIILPLLCLLATIIISAVYYGQLPDNVTFRFDIHGNPSAEMAKTSFIVLMIGIQALLTLVAYITTSAIGNIPVLRDNTDKFKFNPGRLLALIGNMPAIIQLIMAYVLVDAVIYAKQAEHIIPLWVFAVVTLVIGGGIILVFGVPIAIKGYKAITGVEEKKKD